jgi:hypothetical protein
MDYTTSDAYATDAGTGNRMHQDTAAVTTAVTAQDANGLIWEMLSVIKGAGLTPVAFDKTVPGSYTQVYQAIQLMIAGTVNNDYKTSVRAATTAPINLAAPGAAIDDVAMAVGDRFLDKDNANGILRGIYIWNGAAVAATRATDADGVGELTSGAVVAVEEGTANADSEWMLTTDGTITIGTTALTFTRKDADSAATGVRNKLINGAMAIDQRNAGAAQTFTAAAALAYCVDRWYGYCTGANVTGQRVAGTAPNQYNYRFTGAAGVTKIGFAQRIEAANCQDLAGKTATLSVDLANSLLTTVTWTAWYANTADTFGSLASPTRTQIATGVFTVNPALARYNAQISIPAAATTGIEIEFSVGAQISGTWTIGRVQLEPGAGATSFEQRQTGAELSLCQRYAVNFPGGSGDRLAIGYNYSASQGVFPLVLPVEMRSAPSLVGTPGSITFNDNVTGYAASSPTLGQATSKHVIMSFSGATGMAFPRPGQVYFTSANSNLVLSAEL